MKKTSFLSLLILASVAALLLSGCQKDSTTLRLRFDSFGGNSKVWIDGNTPKWNNGDPIWINENRVEVASAMSSTLTVASAPSYRAVYPYSIVTASSGNTVNLSIPQDQLYSEVNNKQVVNAPMVAYTTGSTLTFRNLGALLAITVQNNTNSATFAIKEIRVSSKGHTLPLWGTATVSDITDPNASLQCVAATGNNVDPYSVYLRKYNSNNQQEAIYTFNANTGDASYKTFYVYVPVHGNVNNSFRIDVVPMSGTTVWREQSSASGGNLERNQLVTVPFELRRVEAPTGAVPEGKFSINSSGTQVYFASGNLQYNCSTQVWRIAPHQYDYIGGDQASGSRFGGNVSGCTNNSINSSTYSGWIDLFGWATSGYHDASDSYNTRYLPTSWQNSNTSSTVNQYGYGPSTNMTNKTTLDGVNANYDWGVYHSNPSTGDNPNGGLYYVDGNNNLQKAGPGANWRTLTAVEWQYLLSVRTVNGGVGEHHAWSVVTCNGVVGILIYPDGYLDQLTPTSTNHRYATISSVPERCVFLPQAGQRTVATSDNESSPCMSTTVKGFYWSVSGTSAQKAQYAYAFDFNVNVNDVNADPVFNYTYFTYRYLGCSVRLVTPVI